MSSLRATRLLNAVEVGSVSASALEALLSDNQGRPGELRVLFNQRGQAGRIASNPSVVATLVNSPTALAAISDSQVLLAAISNVPTARVAVRNAGNAILRRLLQSKQLKSEDYQSWPEQFQWLRQNLPPLNNEEGSGSADNATWKAITHGDSKYVVVAINSSACAVSTDGVVWTTGNLPVTAAWTSVAYGGPNGAKLFVAVARSSGAYATSADGTNWVIRQLPKIADWRSIVWRGSYFRVVALGSTEEAQSSDGINWTIVAGGATFTENLTVSGGSQGTPITLSLTNSGTATIPKGTTELNITGRGGAGYLQAGGSLLDLNGSGYPVTDSPNAQPVEGIVYGDGAWMAYDGFINHGGREGFMNHLLRSVDGYNWTYRRAMINGNPAGNGGPQFRFACITYGNGRFIAHGYGDHRILFSDDAGANWTEQYGLLSGQSAMAYGNGRFVAIYPRSADAHQARWSTTGAGWTESTGTRLSGSGGEGFNQIAFGNGRFVAISKNHIKTGYSTDGATWSAAGDLPASQSWRKLLFAGGYFVALSVGSATNTIVYSTDGSSWQVANLPSARNWVNLAYVNGRWVVGTAAGYTASSTNLTAWVENPFDSGGGWGVQAQAVMCDSPAAPRLVTLMDTWYPSGINPVIGASYAFRKTESLDGQTFSQLRFYPGAEASVTVLGQNYTYPGSTTTTTPAARTDTIALNSANATVISYSAPSGTLVAGTFLATDIQVPLVGTGSVSIPTGTTRLTITAKGAPGATATSRVIPNTSSEGKWSSPAFGNGKWVSVHSDINPSNQNNVATSTDGINWTTSEMPGGFKGWTDITFGGGKFVAIRSADAGQVFAHSTDGVAWVIVQPTALAVAAAGRWASVTYGAGKFVAVGSGTTSNVLTSSDGATWSTTNIAGGLKWNGVIYGSDRFVAVSSDVGANGNNNIAHSTDGVTWTRVGISGNTALAYNNVAFGGGVYVAVGTRVATSPDGIAWTLQTALGYSLEDVTYGNTRFVATYASNGVAAPVYSTDGAAWTAGVLSNATPVQGRYASIGFANNLFVAVATVNGQIAYSSNASNWSTSTPATTGEAATVTVFGITHTFPGSAGGSEPVEQSQDVALNSNNTTSVTYVTPVGAVSRVSYSGGSSTQIVNTAATVVAWATSGSRYVAISSEGKVATSGDGIAWQIAAMPANLQWNSVAFGAGRFVALAYDTSVAATSADGVTWTQRAMPTSAKWGGLAIGTVASNPRFLALSEFSTILASSADGITWTQGAITALPASNIEAGTLTQITLTGSASVTVPAGVSSLTITGRGGAGVSAVTTPTYSADGTAWTGSISAIATLAVVYGAGTFVAVAADSYVYTSSDGTNWVQRARSGTAFNDIAYGGGRFVLVTDTTIHYSTDGITWSNTTVTRGAHSVVYGGGKFVAVRKHASANLSYSNDGITWTEASIVSGTGLWADVAYGGGKWVAVNNLATNNVAHSADGTNWTVVNGPGLGLSRIAFGAGKFVALAANGSTGSHSADGVNWTTSSGFPAAPGGQTWDDITYGNGKFLLVGSSGRVSVSADAVNWATTVAGHATSAWKAATWGNARFVIVGSGSTATTAVSPDVVSGSTEVTPAQPGANATVTVLGQPYVYAGSNTSATPAYSANTVTLNPASSTIVDYAVPSGTAASLSYIAAAVSVTPVNPQLPVGTSWVKAAFGNGTFVAVASGTNISATSPDGINWTQRVMPVNTSWASVRFVNGLFLAVSSVSSICATSTDGINWTQREMPQVASQGIGSPVNTALVNNNTTTDVLSLKYNDVEIRYWGSEPSGWNSTQIVSNGTMLVGRFTNGVMRSFDGINWIKDATSPGSGIEGVINYDAGRGFLLTQRAGTSGLSVYRSLDGITWAYTASTAKTWTTDGITFYLAPAAITTSNNRYVAILKDTVAVNGGVGATGGTTHYASALSWSNDGVTWSNPINAHYYSITQGQSSSLFARAGAWEDVTYGDGIFAALRGNASNATRLWTSTDGITWTQQSSPESDLLAGVKSRVQYVNGYFFWMSNQNYAYVSGNSTTYYSGGGELNMFRGSVVSGAIVWTRVNLPFNFPPGVQTTGVYFGGGKWFYNGDRGRTTPVGGSGAWQMYSTDGMQWYKINEPDPETYRGLGWYQSAYVNGRFVMFDVPTLSGGPYANRLRLAYLPDDATTWVTTAQNTNGSLTVPSGVTTITLTGTGGTNNGGADFVVKLRGVNYAFPGSTTTTPPAAKSFQITLDNASPNVLTYTMRDGAQAQFSYSPTVTVYSHATWTDSAYGNGVTSAVAKGGKVAATTGDNINWTVRELPRVAAWAGLAFGAGVHVAVAPGAYSASAVDGSVWAQRAMPNDLNWSAVAFGAGRFVAVSREPTKTQAFAHSSDGVTWTAITLPVAAEWVDIAYRNNVFLAVSANNNVVVTSADGIIWTQRLLPATANWSALATDGDRILGISNGSTTAFITFDGQNFNQSASSGSGTLPGSGATSRWNAIAFGNGLFVALAKDSSIAVVSADGINWTAREMPSDSTWNALAFGNGKFVALTENNTVGAYSADGLNWIATALPVSQRWMSVVAGSRGFVAISADSSVSLSSRDGITWTARSMPSTKKWVDVAYGNNLYMAVSENTTDVATSPDGVTWTAQSAVSAGLVSVTHGNGIFVALCANDAGVDVSTDGINWIQCGLPALIDWSSVSFGNGVFVAVAKNSATIATSTDGIDWDIQTLPNVANWRDIAFGNGLFCAITDTRVMATNC